MFINKYRITIFSIFTAITVLIIDLQIRNNYLSQFSFNDVFFYIISFISELLLLLILFSLFDKQKILAGLLISIYLTVIITSYSFYFYFNTLPGINTFAFLFLSPENSISIINDGISIFQLITIVGIIAIVLAVMYKNTGKYKSNSKMMLTIYLTVFVLLNLVLNNNLKFKDNRTLPFTNAVFSIKQGFTEYKKYEQADKIGSRSYNLPEVKSKEQSDFNILLIMNEGLSPFYLMEYDYKFATDSCINSFINNNRTDIFLFEKAFSNSTVTAVSVPFTVAGVNPVQGKHQLSNIPLVYEMLENNYDNVATSIITSWSYDELSRYKDYFSSEKLDYFIYREKINAPKVVDMAADDNLIIDEFTKFTNSLKKGEKFFSFLHFSNTHYPYYSPEKFKKNNFEDGLLNNYLNSITYLDKNIDKLFKVLEKKNLMKNTIIIFTSDHSESLGEHIEEKGHFGKFSVFKNKIPMWIYVPGEIHCKIESKRGNATEQIRKNTDLPVSNNDIIPTILDLYNLQKPEYMKYGNSLFNKLDTARNIFIYNGKGENRTDSKEYFGIISNDKYFIASGYEDVSYSLYNLNDCYQEHNFWETTLQSDRTAFIKKTKEVFK